MKVLITGNMGYVGSVLVRHLSKCLPEVELHGLDVGFFAHCLTSHAGMPEVLLKTQHFADIRDFDASCFEGVDAVVHLAAISNDPMGSKYEKVTKEINLAASTELAKKAKSAGVKKFIFASSCSMYGAASGEAKKENDQLNPLTAYAVSKVGFEQVLWDIADNDFEVTALRFSTACGFSDRVRLDLVLNDFVACALTTKTITVLSDGSPWRPLIDTRDMARAIEWAIGRDGESFVACNVGSSAWNYQVGELAEAVARKVPGTSVSINKDAPEDKRSYKVNFDYFMSLAPNHQPQIDLDSSIDGLIAGLTEIGFVESEFRNSEFMRLKVLENSVEKGILSDDLKRVS
jgi:nucleoside-diphosphate-sugar epimerase